jgi:hypothetical protein
MADVTHALSIVPACGAGPDVSATPPATPPASMPSTATPTSGMRLRGFLWLAICPSSPLRATAARARRDQEIKLLLHGDTGGMRLSLKQAAVVPKMTRCNY